MLQCWADAITKKKEVPQLDAPRVGGVNDVGVWTGHGTGDDHMPRTSNCMRRFMMDEAKSYSMVKDIEKDARAGLQSTSSPLFCLPTEKDAKDVVTRQ